MLDANQFFGGGEKGFYDHPINQSLRFNDDDNASLTWTPASAGNRKTWTWSGWVKRGETDQFNSFFAAYIDSSNYEWIGFESSGNLRYDLVSGASEKDRIKWSPLHRDSSSWYHIVLVKDSTESTAENRIKLYVNGEQITNTTYANYPALNEVSRFSNTVTHGLGRNHNNYFDGYLSEVHFIDGTALDADSFGETKSGVWIPKEYTGSYGTNGFYLPFKNDYTVEGFSTVTYLGTGSEQYIGGVGFEPDLLWIKKRSSAENHGIFDSIRGANGRLQPDNTDAESTTGLQIESFESDGFTLSGTAPVQFNQSGETFVAWAWDTGTGSAVSNTDGSITSTVKANTDYGFSIVSYTGNGLTGATVGHGLNSAPDLIILKNRSRSVYWRVYHSELTNDYNLFLNETDAQTVTPYGGYIDDVTSSVFRVNGAGGNALATNHGSENYIAYCFHSVDGYSDFGSYTGTGASGNTVTTGFKPAFVMIKATNSTAYGSWRIFDGNRKDKTLYPNLSDAEFSGHEVTFTDTGFTVDATYSGINASGDSLIYMAFADTREAAFWLDDSGNNNDWENNNLTESDIVLDSPTNNFATLNPLDRYPSTYLSLSEGNLLVNGGPTTGYTNCGSTFYQNSGKWYVEFIQKSRAGSTWTACGLVEHDINHNGYLGQFNGTYAYLDNGGFYYNGSAASTGTTYAVGDVIAYAVDFDAGEIKMYKNNSLVYTFSSLATGVDYGFGGFGYSSGDNSVINFGQDSSFAGNKTPQGNTDANGIGDFYYAPPEGYLALCTANLPEPAFSPADDASPQDHFNTVLYSGNSSTQSVTGVGFQPDFTWIKSRNIGGTNHNIYDAVRGAGKFIMSNLTDAEVSAPEMTSFDSDGFSFSGTAFDSNNSGNNYVAWNWKANGSGVSNTDGSITSTVSANTDAGFSIVSYTGNGTNGATVGHGLTEAPEMVLIKQRTTSGHHWKSIMPPLGAGKALYLDLTNAVATGQWNNTLPTSTVFTLDTDTNCNENTAEHIAYCFHSVDGFSKFGLYTGNGSTDGPFVYTGFKPAFVITKDTDNASNWQILDNTRTPENDGGRDLLRANTSDAEISDGNEVDFLSNGFKQRSSDGSVNASGRVYIYMAFAEMPTKYCASMAR